MVAKRSRLFRNAVRAVVYPALAVLLYATLIEPNWLKITEYDLTSLPGRTPSIAEEVAHRASLRAATSPPAARPPVRILQLTDLHVDNSRGLWRLNAAADYLEELRPDLIVFTGDFFSTRIVDRPAFLTALKRFPAVAPCYAVAGNHDGGAWAAATEGYPTTGELRALLTEAGIRLLENEAVRFPLKGRQLELYGSGDPWAGNCSAPVVAGQESGEIERIVLTHNPDARATFNLYPWRLMLCGHTHGGQVALPGYGPLILPVHHRNYAAGLFPDAWRAMVVSTGIGNIKEIRLNCRPEMTLIRF